MKITINLKASLEVDAGLLFHNLAYTHDNFYLHNGWYVLSSNETYSNQDPIVYFPDIDYSRILSHGIKCRANLKDFSPEEQKKVDFIKQELKPIYNKELKVNKNVLKVYKKNLKPLIKDTVEKLSILFPVLKGKNFIVNCYLSKVGTVGSFEFVNYRKRTVSLDVWLRIDQPYVRVVELLVSAVTRTLEDVSEKLSWRETEAISDFIVKHILGHSDFVGTLDSVSRYRPELLAQSLNFMRTHNIPFSSILTYDQDKNKIYILGRDITADLGAYEFRMLRTLILNANKTVSYHELSHEMYREKALEKFSLWGMSKTVQRIRDHLEEFGVPREYIKTIRGEGVKLMV